MASSSGGTASTDKSKMSPDLHGPPAPIAIVGMGCRWPGAISDASALWDLLVEKRSTYAEFGPDKISVDGFHHPNRLRPGSMCSRGGHLLADDPKLFDHAFFGISPVETMTLDPAQRKLLEVVYEAFENAGEPWDKFSGSRTGVFVGNFNYDHNLMSCQDSDHMLPYVGTGGGVTILSNRINHVFNLRGPSMTVDTGCSSSMYALHLAVTALRGGDCDRAIVAGSNLILGPDVQLMTTKLGVISPTSTCHTFDARADGYSRGEGFGAIYLKKVPEALANGDPIRAIIRGTAINTNGKDEAITNPSADGQEAVIRQAYANAGGLDPSQTGYFMAHGTGTPVGDQTEVNAIGRVFRPNRHGRLPIGSIKPNLGHSESASGVAAVMAAVLSIENALIPPNRGIERLNPAIDFYAAHVEVPQQARYWPSGALRRVSINCFGYGGANGHAIIEDPVILLPHHTPRNGRRVHPRSNLDPYIVETPLPSQIGHNPPKLNGSAFQNGHAQRAHIEKEPAESRNAEYTSNGKHESNQKSVSNGERIFATESTSDLIHLSRSSKLWFRLPPLVPAELPQSRDSVLLTLSAHSETSLKASIGSLAKTVNDFEISDVAYTLSTRRSKFAHRAFALASSNDPSTALNDASMTLCKLTGSPVEKIGFVFTGQGAQWPGMGAQLISKFEIFRSIIRYQDHVLHCLSMYPNWRIEDVLLKPGLQHFINDAEFSQTICTAVQVGLVVLLRSWGIDPIATVGHSSGEIAAAYAAGLITAAEAITTAYCRGLAVKTNTMTGAMLAVGLGVHDVEPYLLNLRDHVKIAAVNSHAMVTLAGDTEQVGLLHQEFERKKIFARMLRTGGNAYHSHHMVAIGNNYEDLLNQGLENIETLIHNEPARPHSVSWYSSLRPFKPKSEYQLGPKYWRENFESCVLFHDAMKQFVQESPEVQLLIEIGPHPALSPILKQIRDDFTSQSLTLPPSLPTLKRGQDGLSDILNLAGQLFLLGTSVNFAAVNAMDRINNGVLELTHGSVCNELPNYTYNYGPVLYYENRINKEWRQRKHLRHDILGARQPGTTQNRPFWRNVLRLKDVPWLSDHQLLPNPVFPGAGYIAMAVEAAAQLHQEIADYDAIHGFRLSNVSIKSALQVPDSTVGVETILTMQPVSLTSSKSSKKWYEFSISSFSPHSELWTENCGGRICVETSRQRQSRNPVAENPTRSVDVRRWYETFHKTGLDYGPCFQGLSDLRADYDANLASARVNLESAAGQIEGESAYHLHPAALDACIQLALIACHSGETSRAHRAHVPVSIGEIAIWCTPLHHEKPTFGNAIAQGSFVGVREVHTTSTLRDPSGDVLMETKGLRCVQYDSETDLSEENLQCEPFHRVAWKPCIDSLSRKAASVMFPPTKTADDVLPIFQELNRLSAHIITHIYNSNYTFHAAPNNKDLQEFLAWINKYATSPPDEHKQIFEEAAANTAKTRLSVIESCLSKLHDVVEARIIGNIFNSLQPILLGETNGLEVALKDGLLGQLYTTGISTCAAYPQLTNVIDLISHKHPRAKYLEIGAGTGGATRHILQSIGGKSPKLYGSYMYTDVTPSFFSKAEDEFSHYGGMDFKTLDIEQNPEKQGFSADYDVVIASQVLHATTSIRRTLRNARQLLRTGGKLILVELIKMNLYGGIVLGTFPDFWKGLDDRRTGEVFLSKAQWDKELRESGFSGLDQALDDYPDPVTSASILVSTAQDITKGPQEIMMHSPKTAIVHAGNRSSAMESLIQSLMSSGAADVSVPIANCRYMKAERLVCLLDLDKTGSFYESNESFQDLKSLFETAKAVFWVSAGDIITGKSPEAAISIALLRSLRREMPQTQFFSIDLEREALLNPVRSAIIVAEKTKHLQDGLHLAIDTEHAFHNGNFYVPRLVPDLILNEQSEVRQQYHTEHPIHSLPVGEQKPLTIAFSQPGVISSLYFKEDHLFDQGLPGDWVELQTGAIGLNMKDIAVATGHFPSNKFSLECSGTVTRIGAAVRELQVGDRVYGFMPGNFGNYVRGPASWLQKAPLGARFEELASLPVAYLTAIYAFEHVARLSEGETVLIQSAAGGLGLAAIQVARRFGAEIYATVGSSEKAKFLTEHMGISADRIFSSREIDSPSKIMASTGEKGLDVILCSAAGEMMHETLQCIAPMGRFVEVGRTDVIDAGRIGLEVFQRNATFSSFDLSLIAKQKPALIARLASRLGQLYNSGHIKPIDSINSFDVSQLAEAMARFGKGMHIGKCVITYEDPCSLIAVSNPPPSTRFDPEGIYLMVGCLGGAGGSISMWMAEHGAKRLAFLSRSGASNEEAKALLKQLERRGVETQVFRCDICDTDALNAAIADVSRRYPIRGVLNAAAVFQDATFANTTVDQLQRVLRPKVQGTQNLHHATLNQPLSFFTMTSSVIGVAGTAGQAAYCAANAFQDAFAQHRRSLGLCAQSLALGPLLDVGYASTRPELQRALERNGLYGTREAELWAILEEAFLPEAMNGGAHLLAALEPRRILALSTDRASPVDFVWRDDGMFGGIVQAIEDAAIQQRHVAGSSVHGKAGVAFGAGEGAVDFSDPQQARAAVVQALRVRLAKLLFVSVDEVLSDGSIVHYGLDSMIAAELKSWLMKTFGVNIAFLDLMDARTTVEGLADKVVSAKEV